MAFAHVDALPGTPPSLSVATFFTEARLELLPAVLILGMGVLYAIGVRTMSRRGRSWPVTRTASFVGGLVALAAATQSGLASYDTTLFSAHVGQHVLLGIVAAVALTIWLVRRLYHGRVRRGAAWDCGFPAQTARMQDTAEGFGQPIRQIFEAFFRMERELPSPHDREPRYAVRVEDRFWYWLYLPIARYVDALSRLASLIQQGRISVYLAYSFVTLIALLFFVQ